MKDTFRTVLTLAKNEFEIDFNDQICAIGSCFAENISNLLQKGRFSILVNPFGIIYNPASISETLQLLFGEAPYPEEYLVKQGEWWYSFLHHGKFSDSSRNTLLNDITLELEKARSFAKKCTKMIITLGSATVYELKSSGKIVANCHKIPNQQFIKKRLTTAQCTDFLLPVLEQIKHDYPAIEIIITVSPIRHIRDGFVENQLSKSTLLLCCDALQRHLPFVHYFPAYELIMDDLRDYRFYSSDMIHPNEVAIEYVWKQFMNCFFSDETKKIYNEIMDLERIKQHRPIHPESMEYDQLQKKIAEKESALSAKYPFLQ